jgi:hypothetical protein
MLTDFLDNTCNIVEKAKVITGWEEIITDSTIYTWIKCHYYSYNASLDETDSALNTDTARYKVLLEPSKTLVKKNMVIIIIDPALWTIWNFLIEWVKMNRLINW